MATLELIDIAKRFGKDVWAVKEMSIEVEDKEFLVLLGPSGCGKTTTMRMVAGLKMLHEVRYSSKAGTSLMSRLGTDMSAWYSRITRCGRT